MGKENRKSRRRAVHQPAIMLAGDGSLLGKCLMADVSAGGARLEQATAEVPQQFVLVLSRDGRLRRRCQVTWQSGATIGVRFIATLESEIAPA